MIFRFFVNDMFGWDLDAALVVSSGFNGECAAKASDSCSPDGSSNDGATAHGACLRRFCVLVRNYMFWTRCLSVVLRGLGCIWGPLVSFFFYSAFTFSGCLKIHSTIVGR